MALAIAQSTSGSGSGTGLTSSKSLGSTPGVGNLLIAFIGTGNGTTVSTITIDTTKWTVFEIAQNNTDSDIVITALYRYVQAGDTTAMPAFCTAGSTFFSYTVQEISGVNGAWTNDFQSCRFVQQTGAASLTTPPDTTRSANCLGILGFFKYNRSAAATLDAAWTSDVNTFNAGNYGSYGCAHKAISSVNTDISATNTFQASSDTCGMVQLIINGSGAPPTVPYLVRFRSKTSIAAGFPGTVQFGGAPISGHSLVTFLSWQDGSAADPTIGGSWTQWESVAQGAHHQMFGLYRDVSGDTSLLAAIATAGSAFWALYVCEIGGMTGVFSTDKLADQKGAESSSATVTTTSDTTTGASQMDLIAFSEYNAAATTLSQTGAQYTEASFLNNGEYGSWALAFDFHASGGSTVQQTWTKDNATHKTAYIQVRFGHGASTETGVASLAFGALAFTAAGSAAGASHGLMSFQGISFAAAGHLTENAVGNLSFTGVSFHGIGSAFNSALAAMHFGGLRISALGADTGISPSPTNLVVAKNGLDQLQPLTWNVPITDQSGNPSPEFMKKWQKQFDIIRRQFAINQTIVPQSYVDMSISNAIAAAQTFAIAQANNAQAAAEAYTDSRVLPNCITSALPPTPPHGTRGYVTDATGPTFGSPVVGAGGVETPVYFDGAWKVG